MLLPFLLSSFLVLTTSPIYRIPGVNHLAVMTTGSASTSGSGSNQVSSVAGLDTGQMGDIPAQLAQLSEGWLELESDPGLFSSLISDFGCRGVQVEEIYDLQQPFTDQQPSVYGFIFLFNVIEERRNRSRGHGSTHQNDSPSSLLTGDYIDDEEFRNQMFFARQNVPNSCATHAILAVLMNCKQIDIGPTLRRLKNETLQMSPENKGYAISNMPELARAHNNHATPQSCQREQKQTTSTVRVSQRHTATTCEAFHFVSFVPINGRLIEIDGLKEFPIDHGPVDEATPGGWMEEFRQRMLKRLNQRGAEHDIRYNLMAVIPSKYELSSAYLRAMRANQTRLLKIIEILNFSSSFGIFWDHTYSKYMLKETNQVVPVLKKKEEKTDTVGDNATAEKSIEWPTTESLLKCPGQIGLSIDDERISKEANFSLVYNFPERIPQDGVLANDESKTLSAGSVPEDMDVESVSSETLSRPPRPDSAASSASTETASDASSQFNHQFDDDNDTDPAKPVYDRKFFICKFESRGGGGVGESAASVVNPTPAITSTTTSAVKDESASALIHSLLAKFRSYKDHKWTLSEFDTRIKPHLLNDLMLLIAHLNRQINDWRKTHREEQVKHEKFRLDDSRRVHDYDSFITHFLGYFFEQGLLEQMLEETEPEKSTSENSRRGGSGSKAGEKTGAARTGGSGGKKVSGCLPLGNLSNMDFQVNAEQFKLTFENGLFFPSNFSSSITDAELGKFLAGEKTGKGGDTENMES